MALEPINKQKLLSESLSLFTYNSDKLTHPKGQKLNIHMGIGLWSVKDKLSSGLPVDVMPMLLTAAVLRAELLESNPEARPVVILLIADSMAIEAGGEKEEVERIVWSLAPLLELAKLKECTEIVLSSDLVALPELQTIHNLVEGHREMQCYRMDTRHYGYRCTQTAITHYMHEIRDVGFKIGWLYQTSPQQNHSLSLDEAWDEKTFDTFYKRLWPDSAIQFLYCKSGRKQRGSTTINVSEGCPYTSYPKDRRYTIQLESITALKEICPLQKSVTSHWRGTAEICLQLAALDLVHQQIVPQDGIHKTNLPVTMSRLLEHWINWGCRK